LIQGVINRKTLQDPPTGGKEVPVQAVRAIQRTSVREVKRPPFGRAMILCAAVLLAAAWHSTFLLIRGVAGLAGLVFLYWGAERMRARVSFQDAFQLVIPGQRSEDWLVVGSTPEILAFIDSINPEISSPSTAVSV